jgi:hypothetical protein
MTLDRNWTITVVRRPNLSLENIYRGASRVDIQGMKLGDLIDLIKAEVLEEIAKEIAGVRPT